MIVKKYAIVASGFYTKHPAPVYCINFIDPIKPAKWLIHAINHSKTKQENQSYPGNYV